MDVDKLYSKAYEQLKAGNYDVALELLDEIKQLAPDYKGAYYMEASIWQKFENPVKEYCALEKLLPLLDFSTLERRRYATDIFNHISSTLSKLSLNKKATEFYLLAAKTFDNEFLARKRISNMLFNLNSSENFSAADFRALYDEYKKYLPNNPPPVSYTTMRKFV